MVLSCMDPRFQLPVFKFMKKKNLIGKHSSFTIAGSAVGVTHSKFKKWHQPFLQRNIIELYHLFSNLVGQPTGFIAHHLGHLK